jgi:hypothetical protein
VYAKTLRMLATEPELELASLAAVAAPTLVLQGDRDEVTPEHGRRGKPVGHWRASSGTGSQRLLGGRDEAERAFAWPTSPCALRPSCPLTLSSRVVGGCGTRLPGWPAVVPGCVAVPLWP